MLALLFSRSGLYFICVIGMGIIIAYVQYLIIQHLRDRLDGLDAQVAMIQQTSDLLQQDFAAVQKLQQAANQSLAAIRLSATRQEQAVEGRQFTGNPRLLQDQINRAMTDTFTRLEGLSRAP
jgi:cell division septum initiation protein DivIVA